MNFSRKLLSLAVVPWIVCAWSPTAVDSVFPGIVQPVAIIGTDERITVPEYAAKHGMSVADVYKKFGATGYFHCGNFSMTANLVLKSDLLVTVAHAFVHSDMATGKCTPVSEDKLPACFFQKLADGAAGEKYFIDSATLKMGSNCPNLKNNEGDGFVAAGGEDWAFVRLRKQVREVDPYEIYDVSDYGPTAALIGLKLTKVNAVNDRFRKFPPRTTSINDGCENEYVRANFGKYNFVISTCSTDDGNSGAGNFFEDPKTKKPVIFAITSATADKKWDGTPFSLYNSTQAAILYRGFLDELKAEAKRPYDSQ